MNIEFLKSERFWAVVIGAVSIYLESKGFIGEAERNLIASITVLFVGIGTVDRVGKNIGGVKPSVTEFEETQKEL